jgi:molybdopterin/thiamine biosynthesis adenylyltransferase
VVVVTNTQLKDALKLNDFCHRHNIAYIRADIRGVFASVFTDFGDSFTVLDVDGEHEAFLCNQRAASVPRHMFQCLIRHEVAGLLHEGLLSRACEGLNRAPSTSHSRIYLSWESIVPGGSLRQDMKKVCGRY